MPSLMKVIFLRVLPNSVQQRKVRFGEKKWREEETDWRTLERKKSISTNFMDLPPG